MTVELTLQIEESLVEQAKKVSKKQGYPFLKWSLTILHYSTLIQ